MNAPRPVLGNSPHVPPEARKARIQRLLMEWQGMTPEDALARQMAHLIGNGRLPENAGQDAAIEANRHRANLLAALIAKSPGISRLELMQATGMTEHQLRRATETVCFDGRAYSVTQKYRVIAYYPTRVKP